MVCLKFYISKNSCQSFLRPSLVLPKADYHSGGRKYRNIASLTLSRLLSRSLSLTRSLSFQQLPSSRWASLSSQCFPPFLSPALSLPLSPLHLSSLSFSLSHILSRRCLFTFVQKTSDDITHASAADSIFSFSLETTKVCFRFSPTRAKVC